jgi:hypothetical protein
MPVLAVEFNRVKRGAEAARKRTGSRSLPREKHMERRFRGAARRQKSGQFDIHFRTPPFCSKRNAKAAGGSAASHPSPSYDSGAMKSF